MPFISEEIWHSFKDRDKEDYLIVTAWPKPKEADETLLKDGDLAFEIITQIRNLRNAKQLSPKLQLALEIRTKATAKFDNFSAIISKMSNLSSISFVDTKPENASGFVIKGDEFFVPLEGEVDAEKEKETLQKELEYTKGFLNSVAKKLSNERFVNNAPEQVIANERKKMADAEAKVKALEEQLAVM